MSEIVVDDAEMKVGQPINNLPSKEMIGTNITSAELKLCATLSKDVYDLSIQNRIDLKHKLKENKEISKEFPDLDVRWFQNGVTVGKAIISERVSFNKPTFTGVLIGTTLILCWRGTVTIQDVIKDLAFESVIPDRSWGEKMKGLEVQGTHAKMIKSHLKHHIKDIKRYIEGKYMTDLNRPWDGSIQTPIKKIICTGHSLGGGLAQVAHLLLTVPGTTWCVADETNTVSVETIAFSAPMTILFKDDDSYYEETETFLETVIKPKMRNIIFNGDIVPRYASNFQYLNEFIDEFGREPMVDGRIAREFMDKVVDFCRNRIEKNKDNLKYYRHVGKVIFYANYDAAPQVYEDWVSNTNSQLHHENNFNSLTYEKPEDGVVNTALIEHSALINPGLAFI